MALAMSELGSISERRVYQLISGTWGEPPFLTENPGLHSGMMIAQYTAASIVSQSKTLCMPASADSIVSLQWSRRPCQHGRQCSHQSDAGGTQFGAFVGDRVNDCDASPRF